MLLLSLIGLRTLNVAYAEDCFEIEDYRVWFECEIQEAGSVDALLNEVYKQVMARMDPSGNATGRENLRNAQRAWIAFRDAECHYRTDGLGSIKPAILAMCIEEHTKKRIEELRYYLTCFEGDLSCPSWN